MNDLYQMPGHLIRRAHQISTALFAQECASFDVTSVQYAALRAIQAHPDVDATRLSYLIAFDRSTLGSVLDRLEIKQWVQRHGSPADRRIKLLRLTEAGEHLLQRVDVAVRRSQSRLVQPLELDDQAALLRVLTRLADLHNEITSAPKRAIDPR